MQSANRRIPLRSADNSPFRRHFTLTPLLFFFYVLYYIQYYTVCQEVSRFLFKMFFRQLYTAVYFTRPPLSCARYVYSNKIFAICYPVFFHYFSWFLYRKKKSNQKKKNLGGNSLPCTVLSLPKNTADFFQNSSRRIYEKRRLCCDATKWKF